MSLASSSLPLTAKRGRWLAFLCVTLLGYALFGKGWAYLGVPPIFIGELVLVFGLVSFVLFTPWQVVLRLPSVWVLLLLMAWCATRTFPDISQYGVDSLRDGVLWGYGVFALIVCGSILAQPERLTVVLRWYRRFCRFFPVLVPILWLVSRFFGDSLPRWSQGNAPIIDPKGGDLLVHLAGVLAFGVAGFCGPAGLLRPVLLVFCVGFVGAWDRAGLLAFLAVFSLCLLAKPFDRCLWRMVILGVCGLALLAASGIRIQMPEREREISFEQLATNLGSVTGSARTGDLDDTKEWRLQWWSDIVDYTFFGQYFWTGKGFGINLCVDDGYHQGTAEPVLRSPHNSHITMLARAGVPGFAMWILLQMVWVCSLLCAYRRALRLGDRQWSQLFLFLLAYWLAFTINANFDVVLEGPHGGIWYWTIYGVGLAAMWLYRHCPWTLPANVIGD